MHAREATIGSQFAHRVAVAYWLRDITDELIDDVTQAMQLHLARNVARNPAGVLDILLAMCDFPHRLGLGSNWVPHLDGKNQRVPARIVVKNGFGRRVGKNSAIRIELAVDADGREGRRQRAGGG